jgi:hypothetical protein
MPSQINETTPEILDQIKQAKRAIELFKLSPRHFSPFEKEACTVLIFSAMVQLQNAANDLELAAMGKDQTVGTIDPEKTDQDIAALRRAILGMIAELRKKM